MKHSLQRKLLYSYIMVVVLVLAGVSAGISLLLREYFLASKQQELIAKGHELGRLVTSYSEGRLDQNQFAGLIDSIDALLGARVWVVDASRRVIAVSSPRRGGGGQGMGPGMGRGMGPGGGQGQGLGGMLTRALLDRLEPVFAGQVLARSFYHPIYGENMLIVAVPVTKADGTVNGAVVLNAPIRGVDEFLQRIYFYIGGLGLAALLLTFLLVRQLARGVTRPLRDMQEAAATMARGDYGIRVKDDGGDEVGQLGRSLNSLAQELGRFVAATDKMEKLRRDFVANISHELRTPLTVIRGYTEALLDGTAPAKEADKYHRLMRDETVRLEGLINELLDLSRLQADGTALHLERLPLASVADGVVSLLGPKAEQAGICLTLETDGDTAINGNGDRLTQLLLILLDNALKFTPAGGRITVGVARRDGEVRLQVADTGRGIAREDLPFIWERFYKADKSHSRTAAAGTGLGLAIAREIAARHGARAEVASELGKGSTFTVCFPAA